MTSVAAPTQPRRRGRPPKDQTLPDALRARLLRKGAEALTARGFTATGVEEILTSAGVPKGSLYYYFDSRDALVLALIDAYAEYFAHKLDRWFEDEQRAPLDRLRACLADARAGMARFDFRRGCLVGNLGQEMGALPEPFRDRLLAVLRDWEQRTARCLRAAQEAGEIGGDADFAWLANFFWIGWEGAVLRAKLERRPDALDAFADGFLSMISISSEVTG